MDTSCRKNIRKIEPYHICLLTFFSKICMLFMTRIFVSERMLLLPRWGEGVCIHAEWMQHHNQVGKSFMNL